MGAPEILGFFAAIFTMIAFIPQAIKVIIGRQTSGLSLTMLFLQVIGNMLWVIYGLWIRSPSVSIANVFTFLIVLTVILFKLYFDYKNI